MDTPRAILHIDMDAFFASVEQHDHPEWRGKPVIVGAAPDQRGVVSTCSYEARKYGVHSAMPSRQAFERCPQGIFTKPRMARYQEVSTAVFDIFAAFTPLVEGLSIDEAFLDVTGVRRLHGEPEAIARKIKARIFEEQGLTCSVGIAPNKFLAKLASEEKKPDGLFVVPQQPQALLSWLGKKKIEALWGVGPKLREALNKAGYTAVRDLQSTTPEALDAIVTPHTRDHLLAIAFGRDSRPLETEREEQSFSRERTFLEDTTDVTLLRDTLRDIAEDVGRRLRRHGVWAKTGRIKIRTADFKTVTRQATFESPVCDDFALRDMAWALFARRYTPETPIRLIGFGAENLVDSPLPPPRDDLFAALEPPQNPRAKFEQICRTLDKLRETRPQ